MINNFYDRGARKKIGLVFFAKLREYAFEIKMFFYKMAGVYISKNHFARKFDKKKKKKIQHFFVFQMKAFHLIKLRRVSMKAARMELE